MNMPIYYIVKYHFTNPAKIIAFTHSLENAREICSHPDTKSKCKNIKNSWFYGFTEHPPCKVSKRGYPSGGDLLKELPNNHYGRVSLN